MRSKPEDVASGMHRPAGEAMWAYPADDDLLDEKDEEVELTKEAIGLTSFPGEQQKDYQFEQAHHIKDPDNVGVIDVDTVVDLPPSNYSSDLKTENEVDDLLGELEEELVSKGYFEEVQMIRRNAAPQNNLETERARLNQLTNNIQRYFAYGYFTAEDLQQVISGQKDLETFLGGVSNKIKILDNQVRANIAKYIQQYKRVNFILNEQEKLRSFLPNLHTYYNAGYVDQAELEQALKGGLDINTFLNNMTGKMKDSSDAERTRARNDIYNYVMQYRKVENYLDGATPKKMASRKEIKSTIMLNINDTNSMENIMRESDITQALQKLASQLKDRGYHQEAELLKKEAQDPRHQAEQDITRKNIEGFKNAFRNMGVTEANLNLYLSYAIPYIKEYAKKYADNVMAGATVPVLGPRQIFEIWDKISSQKNLPKLSVKAPPIAYQGPGASPAYYGPEMPVGKQPAGETQSTRRAPQRTYRFSGETNAIDRIKVIQRALGVIPDGYWGTQTDAAWKRNYPTYNGESFPSDLTEAEEIVFPGRGFSTAPSVATPAAEAPPPQSPASAPAKSTEEYMATAIREMMTKGAIRFNTPFRPEAGKTTKWVNEYFGGSPQEAARHILANFTQYDWNELVGKDRQAIETGGRQEAGGKVYKYRSGEFFEALYQSLKASHKSEKGKARAARKASRVSQISHIDYIIKKSSVG